MVNKNIVTVLFFSFIFLNVFTQETEEKARLNLEAKRQQETEETQKNKKTKERKNYFIEEGSGDDAVLYQRLSWEEGEDIFGFEFRLEKLEAGGKWKQIEKKTLKDNFINVSLPPGKYRYKVAVINLLRQPEEESDYRNFTIRIAHQPVVSSVSVTLLYLDDIEDDTITVTGADFHEDTEFFLQKKTGFTVYKGEPVELNADGKRAKIRFNMAAIDPGEYMFTVQDPSGLKDDKHRIVFKFQKPFDTFLSAGYAFSGFAGNPLKAYYGKNFSAESGIFRITFIPIKRRFGNFGINLSVSAMNLKSKNDDYTLGGHLTFLSHEIAYIYPLKKKLLNLDAHLGLGYAFLTGVQFVYNKSNTKSPSLRYWGMTLNAGAALQVYLYKKLYAEINLEHIINFRKGFPAYVVQPSFSVGWEF